MHPLFLLAAYDTYIMGLAESAYTPVTDGYSPVINISPSPILNRPSQIYITPSQNKISPSRIILYIFNYSKFFFKLLSHNFAG